MTLGYSSWALGNAFFAFSLMSRICFPQNLKKDKSVGCSNHHLSGKHISKIGCVTPVFPVKWRNIRLMNTFHDLEKEFTYVPYKVIWFALRQNLVPEKLRDLKSKGTSKTATCHTDIHLGGDLSSKRGITTLCSWSKIKPVESLPMARTCRNWTLYL